MNDRVRYSDQVLEPKTIECLNRYFNEDPRFWKEKSDNANMKLHIDGWFTKAGKNADVHSIDFKHYGYYADGDHSIDGKFYAEVLTTSFDDRQVKGSLYGQQEYFLLAPSWTSWYFVKRKDLQEYIEARVDMSSEPIETSQLMTLAKSKRMGGVIVYFDPLELPSEVKLHHIPNLFDYFNVHV